MLDSAANVAISIRRRVKARSHLTGHTPDTIIRSDRERGAGIRPRRINVPARQQRTSVLLTLHQAAEYFDDADWLHRAKFARVEELPVADRTRLVRDVAAKPIHHPNQRR